MQRINSPITIINLDEVSDLLEVSEIMETKEVEGICAYSVKHPQEGLIVVLTSLSSDGCMKIAQS